MYNINILIINIAYALCYGESKKLYGKKSNITSSTHKVKTFKKDKKKTRSQESHAREKGKEEVQIKKLDNGTKLYYTYIVSCILIGFFAHIALIYNALSFVIVFMEIKG